MSDAPLWERQPWDTSASFDRFVRFYLPQTPLRSVEAAYRAYYVEKRGLTAGETPVEKAAPGSWQRWSRGQDIRGQAIDGAKSWADRAQAYDDHLAALERTKWEKRRAKIVERDYQVGEDLRKLADQMLEHGPQFLKTTRRLIKGQKDQPDQVVTTVELDGAFLLRALKLASEMQRLSAGMPDPAQSVDVTSGGQPVLQIIPGVIDAIRQLGLDPLKLFKQIIDEAKANTL